MLKKLNQITNITIGSFVGVFIGCGIYVFCDYKKHPDLYVQCRILFQSNPSFRGVVAYLCFGGIASGKRKKPENHLVASDIF